MTAEYERWAATTGLALEQEVNGWMQKCQAVEAERDALRLKVDAWHDEAQRLSDELGKAEAENERLREQLLNREADVEGLESTRAGDDMAIEMLKDENERLQTLLEDTCLQAKLQREQHRAEIGRLKQDHHSACVRNDAFVLEIERLRADLDAERNNIVLYADDRNEWHAEAERLRAALERIAEAHPHFQHKCGCIICEVLAGAKRA